MQIDPIFEILSDGKKHSLKEISTSKLLLKSPLGNIETILRFLAEYGFITIFEAGTRPAPAMRAKITPPMQEFLRRIKGLNTQKSAIVIEEEI